MARLQGLRMLAPRPAAFRPKAPIVKLTPERAFLNAAPIDPNTPHSYFLNRGIDTTRFSDLDQVVRITPRYRRKQTAAWRPALVAAITDNEGRIVGQQYKPLNADRSAKDGVEPKIKNGLDDKVKGFAMRFGPALHVAEGLEDAMTVMQAFDMAITAFAMGGTGMMDGFIPSKGRARSSLPPIAMRKGFRPLRRPSSGSPRWDLRVRGALPPEDFKDFNAAVTGNLDGAPDKAQAAVRAAVDAAEVRFVSPFSAGEGRRNPDVR
jgi:hypothetical protein